jgi:dolichol-phosphate mannosyltransferase
MKKLSVVVPLYNEEQVLPELVVRLSDALSATNVAYEIVFVDDGSSDGTVSILADTAKDDTRIKVVALSRNFGHQAAVSAGIDAVDGDAVVVMDGDLQDPPELIHDFLEKFREGFDVVYAIRRARKEVWWKRAGYNLFYRILSTFASGGVAIPRDAGDFSLMSRRVVDIIRAMPERNRYVRGLRAWAGFRQIGIPYNRDARYAGKTKYSLWKLVRFAYDGLFAFSYVPIMIVNAIGFLSSAVAFVGIIAVLYFKLFSTRDVPGFTATAVFILFFSGIQLIALGVLGEYMRRMYDEVKARPLYIIGKKINF